MAEQNPAAPPKTDRQKEATNDLVFSYLTLRNLIGISGMLLPVILVIATARGQNDRWIERSISDYYYTSNGDLLVVMLSVLGVFLFTYTGYTWKENALTTVAAVCAIGVAFSPTATKAANSLSIHIAKDTVPIIFGIERHFVFAGLFFLSLAIICLKYFPRTDHPSQLASSGTLTQKAKRNLVFRSCGWIMLVCLAVLGASFLYKPLRDSNFPTVFVFEAIAVEAFGFSWLTKGETLWPDGEHYLARAFRRLKESRKNN